jgi:hypothetical protein
MPRYRTVAASSVVEDGLFAQNVRRGLHIAVKSAWGRLAYILPTYHPYWVPQAPQVTSSRIVPTTTRPRASEAASMVVRTADLSVTKVGRTVLVPVDYSPLAMCRRASYVLAAPAPRRLA